MIGVLQDTASYEDGVYNRLHSDPYQENGAYTPTGIQWNLLQATVGRPKVNVSRLIRNSLLKVSLLVYARDTTGDMLNG